MGGETKGCDGVDELCVGDELKGCVCMLVWGRVMVMKVVRLDGVNRQGDEMLVWCR